MLVRCLVVAALAGLFLSAAPAPIRFNRDVRPIMSDTCFRCHGPDKKSRMAGMRLDLREDAVKPTKSGITPIVPGEPEKSAIIQRIFAPNPAKIMPPVSAHKILTDAQKDTLRRWVAEGAVYEGHWAYEPVKRPSVPQLGGVENPVDAFIRARLQQDKLTPSPQADGRTLLRRVTLDLTGLPPTPAELDAFLADKSPNAYEKVVDRLLASPAHAEKQAMYWLDAVRYADSAGFHGDNLWPAWPYRDYVLRSFRDNKPFDQFTREQIAGDLLPGAPMEGLVASAFNRLNRASAEGGLQPKEYLAKYGADRVRTISTVWMGATMGCAECHDHKFDPFLAKDFYAMKAFFSDVKETGLVPDRGEKAWGSKLLLGTDEQLARLKQLDEAVTNATASLDKQARSKEELRWDWESSVLADHKSGKLAWKFQAPTSAASANGAQLKVYVKEPVEMNYYLNGSLHLENKPGAGLVVASGPNPDNETYTVKFRPGAGTWKSLGIEVFQEESLPGNRLSRGADRFVLTEVDAQFGSQKIPFVLATSTGVGELAHHSPMAAIDGNPATGWAVSYGESRNPFLALRFAEAVTTTAETEVTVRLHHDSALRRAVIGRFRVALSAGKSWPETGDPAAKMRVAKEGNFEQAALTLPVDNGIAPDVLKALQTPEDERTEDQKTAAANFFRWSEESLQPALVAVARAELERNLLDADIPRVLRTERVRPRVTRVLNRGNFLDESGEVVDPAIPGFLGKLDTGGHRATRLDLANWLVSDKNPLTPRVYVNRVWRQLFGTGLSKVLEDLGSQGEPPVHPELIDWLASEFVQPAYVTNGAHSWDMRHLVRTIVTSHTYRQSSALRPEVTEIDPDNRLLARQAPLRVDAEIVHDIALSVSGLLVNKFGGPSVRPYEPEGYLAAMNFPKRDYSASRGEDLYRRGIYTQWQRTFLHPTFATFDAPTREECTVNRVNSNTPLQALDLLNDPIFVEASRVFAQNIVKSGGSGFDERLDWAFRRALDRKPETEERRILRDLYTKNLGRFKTRKDEAAKLSNFGEAPVLKGLDAAEVAAMTTVARTLLNLHETITRN